MHIPITLFGERAENLQLPTAYAGMSIRLLRIGSIKGAVTAMNRQLVEQLVPSFSIFVRRCSCMAHLVLLRNFSSDLLIFTLIDYLRFESISRGARAKRNTRLRLFPPGPCLRNAAERPSAAFAMATVLKCAKTKEISMQVLSACE